MTAPLRLIPLGGLGEIGMNCMAIEHGDDILVLDCGVTFDSRGLGIDLVHADFGYVLDRREKVRGLVLTHGHEDHIGATSWFLRDIPVPVWGPPYALALVKQRIAEHPFHDIERLDLRTMQHGVEYAIGPFSWELWRVTHSIPDAHGIVIRTPVGTIVHSGDFKIDRDPPPGDHMDLARIEEIAREGVRVMMSDSTNALTHGHSGGERQVEQSLEELVRNARDRVVIGLFASNVGRIRALLDVARTTGRKLIPMGRSVDTHLRIAEELGVITDPHDVLVPRDRARNIPREQCLIVATGSQGEGPAALPRLANGTHPDLELGAGDLVILSARIIPGNERAVLELINTLERRGISVVHRGNDPRVHVSGHAHRDEQRELIQLVRPRTFVPVHGTFMHLKAHAEIARDAGVPEVFFFENGQVIELHEDRTELAERVHSGRVHIDHFEPVQERVIRDRTLLAQLGVVFVSLLCDQRGRILDDPQIVSRGVIDEDADYDLLEDLRDDVRDAVETMRVPEDRISDELLRDQVRRAVRRFFGRELGRKPLVYATIARVETRR
ncbi:ribonuclease J [Sandaracinus amylolyticus]|uniref:ribonuclease J n=1 Tax=Sandaracinus amylolyticus TaxID=927083 RepID=UPI00069E3BFC|nr:ribonuclease J [Sandaracinus amylolyticus]